MSKLVAESWNVAIRKSPKGSIISNVNDEFIVLNNDIKYWAADPFVFEKNGKVYIFAELYDYILRRGTIGYCEYNGSPNVQWNQVIVEPFHMSFPFLFEKNGEMFIMPESSENRCVSLYRAVDFPNKWEKCADLVEDDILVDTVLFQDIALTYEDYKSQSADNYLWLCSYNDDKIIKKQKVTNNIEFARMAGAIFEIDGKLYRPSQNCLDGYGKGLNFFSFTVTDGKYAESLVNQIFPNDIKLSKKMFLDGMHTYNFSQNYEIIDIKTTRFNIINFVSRIVGLIKKNSSRQ